MKRDCKSGIALMLVVFIILLAGCSGKNSAPAPDSLATSDKPATSIVWKLATMANDSHQITITMKKLSEEMKKRTNGEVDIQVFANGQLGTSPDQVLGGIQNKVIEMGEIAINNCAEYTTAFIPMDAPFMFLSRDHALRFVDGEAADIIKDRVREEAGLELLAFIDFGFRDLTNSRGPVETVEDLKGLKIRTLSNPIHMKAFESLGALPTAMAFSEVYTALQQKTVDAQENPPDTIYNGKFHEVNNYITISEHVYTFDGLFMNADTYAALPDNIKNALTESLEAIKQEQRDRCIKGIEEAIKLLEDTGANVNYLSEEAKIEFQKAVAPSWELAASKCGKDYFDLIKGYVDAAK